MKRISLQFLTLLFVGSVFFESRGMAKTTQKSKIMRAVTYIGKTLWKHKYKTAGAGLLCFLVWQAEQRNKQVAAQASQWRVAMQERKDLSARVRAAQTRFDALAQRAQKIQVTLINIRTGFGTVASSGMKVYVDVFAEDARGQLPIREILAHIRKDQQVLVKSGAVCMDSLEPYLNALETIIGHIEHLEAAIKKILHEIQPDNDNDAAAHTLIAAKLQEYDKIIKECAEQLKKPEQALQDWYKKFKDIA